MKIAILKARPLNRKFYMRFSEPVYHFGVANEVRIRIFGRSIFIGWGK